MKWIVTGVWLLTVAAGAAALFGWAWRSVAGRPAPRAFDDLATWTEAAVPRWVWDMDEEPWMVPPPM